MRRPVTAEDGGKNTDDDHAHHHTQRTKGKQRPAPDLVDEEEGEEDTGKLAEVGDTGQVESVVVVETQLLEERRRIIDQSIDADELLEGHEQNTDNGPLPAARAEGVDPAPSFESDLVLEAARLVRGVSFLANLIVELGFTSDLEPFRLDEGVVGMPSADLGQRQERFFVATSHGEPTRTWGQDKCAGQEDETGDDLQEEGQTVAPLRVDETRSESDVVCDADTGDNGKLLKAEKNASNVWWRKLTDVDGASAAEEADTDTSDQTTHDEHVVGDGTGLDGTANDEENDTNSNGTTTRELVSDKASTQRTDQGAQFDHGRQDACRKRESRSFVSKTWCRAGSAHACMQATHPC